MVHISKQFNGYDISGFVDSGVSYYLNDIESRVIDMMDSDDKEERVELKFEIQGLIENLMEFIR